jgi:hypothetical protein
MQCPICQALQLGSLALVPIIFVFAAPDLDRIIFDAVAPDRVAERFASPLQARAPPSAS